MRLPFVKMSGAGNDFVVVDHDEIAGLDDEARGLLARRLCARRLSVGADGLISVQNLGRGSVRMIYHNADGSRADMCGNGGRCAARYAVDRGWVGNRLTLDADDGPHSAAVGEGRVTLGMRDPRVLDADIEIRYGNQTFQGISVDTGVPHLVLWVEEVAAVDVDVLGRSFRFDERFRPQGTNVNFAEGLSPSVVGIRTYERGVEAETLACGTGVVAVATAACLQKDAGSPVEVRASGGVLLVGFERDGASLREVTLEGDARVVFEGAAEVEEPVDSGRP